MVWDQIYIWQEQIHIQVSAHVYTIYCSFVTTWSIPPLGIFFITALWQNILTHVKTEFLIKILSRFLSAISNTWYLVLVLERDWSGQKLIECSDKEIIILQLLSGIFVFLSVGAKHAYTWEDDSKFAVALSYMNAS